jgi:hypothetical protein
MLFILAVLELFIEPPPFFLAVLILEARIEPLVFYVEYNIYNVLYNKYNIYNKYERTCINILYIIHHKYNMSIAV